ncbi:MAG: DUF1573 domain-containing protein [Planctomycetota bacterium]|nr:DUF1573 domain-containing protein [Planctomycetota bacterium]MDA1214302.1 DUF1573 domain-containing protein [Planctomycetota bacterium]
MTSSSPVATQEKPTSDTRLAKFAGKSWLLLFLPVVWAFVSFVQGASPSSMAPAPPRPALVFNQYLVDLGPVPPQRFVHAFFQFTNRGKEAVDVTELVPSCGCLKPHLAQRHYAPGESGEFFLKIETAQENPGPHEYFVDINYIDPQPRSARVTFKVTLPYRQVLVEPPGLVFYQLSPVESSREVVITNFRPQPIKVTGIRSNSEYVNADVVSSDRDEDGFQRIKLNVTVPGDVPPGRQVAMVVVSTDDPEFSEIGVHVLIQGPESVIQPAGYLDDRGGERARGRGGEKSSEASR